jgi:hypothetical protein
MKNSISLDEDFSILPYSPASAEDFLTKVKVVDTY